MLLENEKKEAGGRGENREGCGAKTRRAEKRLERAELESKTKGGGERRVRKEWKERSRKARGERMRREEWRESGRGVREKVRSLSYYCTNIYVSRNVCHFTDLCYSTKWFQEPKVVISQNPRPP